jgi:hypothetical protein
MYVYNIRFELEIEIEQTYVVGYPCRTGMKLPAIIAELAAVYQGDTFNKTE